MVTDLILSAQEMIRKVGARVTQPRVCVLAVLLGASRALTHHEVERRVRRSLHVDRVTVYRVLDWLVANQFAHRIAGDDRVWRFNAAADEHADEHAHFKCNQCRQVICLEDTAPPRRIRLPAGYRSHHVEVTVMGLCADCTPPRHARTTVRLR